MTDDFHPSYIQPSAGYDWRCMRCQHEWRSRRPNEPKPRACAKCRSAYWDRPKKEGRDESRTGLEPKRTRKVSRRKRQKKPVAVLKPIDMAALVKMEAAAPRAFGQVTNLNSPVGDDKKDDYSDLPLAPPPHLQQLRQRWINQETPTPEELIRRCNYGEFDSEPESKKPEEL